MLSSKPRATARAAIVEAAEVLFGERGFKKTTLEDIAMSAGITRPLVYRYFGDKNGLFRVVVERVIREWNEVLLAEAARPTSGTAETIRLVLTACLEFAETRTVLRGLLVRDARLIRSVAGDVIEDGRDMLPVLIERILEQGALRGDVRSDLALQDMAHVVTEVFVSYTMLVLGDVQATPSHRRVEAVIETLLHGVIVSTPPTPD